MIENEDGTVAGSIDRTRVAELLAKAKNAEQKAYYRELLGESPEGWAVDEDASNAKSKPSRSDESGTAKKAAASQKSSGGDG